MNLRRIYKTSDQRKSVLTATNLRYLRPFVLSCLIISFLGLKANAQDNSLSSAHSKVREELDEFQNRFLDWVVLSYSTYTGQHNAELESIFAKAKDGLDQRQEVQELLNEIQSSFSDNSLAAVVRDFTNKTGIGIYFAPQFVSNNDDFYEPILNNFLAESAKKPVAPYVIVRPMINGDHERGYSLSYAVETSPDLNAKKYSLDRTNSRNPFHDIAGRVTKRKDMILKLRPNLASAVVSLGNIIDENFLPKMVITYKGHVYRPGEEIELGMQTSPSANIRLIAKNRDGTAPHRAVTWRISPQTVERKVRGSDLLFPLTQAGQWRVLAVSGSLKATVEVKVVDSRFDWRPLVKTMLYELLRNELNRAQAKVNTMESAGAGLASDVRAHLKTIEATNYPLEPDLSQWQSIYDEPQVLKGMDTIRFLSDAARRTSLRQLRKFKKHAIGTLSQVNLAAFIDILLDDPGRFDELMEGLTYNSAALITELAGAGLTPKSRDDKIKDIVINYLNANLEQLADAEFADQHYSPRLITQAIPPATNTIPPTQDPNFYINPYAYFPGIEDFKKELKSSLHAMTHPPFVVINYSQDLSEESYLARAPKGRPKGIPQNREYVVVTVVNSPGSIEEIIVSSDTSRISAGENGELAFNNDANTKETDLAFDYFVSNEDAWQRYSKSPFSTIKPTLEKPKIEQGTQVAVLQIVKSQRKKDVAMMKAKDKADTLYTTLSNLSKVEKLSKELKYKMKQDFESLKLPYGTDNAGKKYTKEDTLTAFKKCGDYIRVKGEGEGDIVGHWISKDSAVIDCGTGFCC